MVENAVFKFKLDSLGFLHPNVQPRIFYNFTKSPGTDIDGMCTDVNGTLYVTRNGQGQVVMLNKDAKHMGTIQFQGASGSSMSLRNIELGGHGGQTLFAVGPCVDDTNHGCAVIATDLTLIAPGKAYTALQGNPV